MDTVSTIRLCARYCDVGAPVRFFDSGDKDDGSRGSESSFENRFTRLVQQEDVPLRRYARRWLKNAADVEDAVQTTWERVWRGRARLSDSKHLQQWTRTVCRNVCIDLLRKRRNARTFVSREDIDRGLPFDPPAPTARLADLTFDPDIIRAVLALPTRQRLVVIWYYMAQKTVDETAQLIGCTPGAVRCTLVQARRSLRGTVDEGAHTPFILPGSETWN